MGKKSTGPDEVEPKPAPKPPPKPIPNCPICHHPVNRCICGRS